MINADSDSNGGGSYSEGKLIIGPSSSITVANNGLRSIVLRAADFNINSQSTIWLNATTVTHIVTLQPTNSIYSSLFLGDYTSMDNETIMNENQLVASSAHLNGVELIGIQTSGKLLLGGSTTHSVVLSQVNYTTNNNNINTITPQLVIIAASASLLSNISIIGLFHLILLLLLLLLLLMILIYIHPLVVMVLIFHYPSLLIVIVIVLVH